MADAITTTSTNPEVLKEFWHKLFLHVAEQNLVFKQLGLRGIVSKGEGSLVHWMGYVNYSAQTGDLTEGTTPDAITGSTLDTTATIAQKGAWVRLSDLFADTKVQGAMDEIVKRLAYNAGFSIDTVIRNACLTGGGSAQYASGVAARNSIATTDVCQIVDFRKAKRTLDEAATPKWPGEKYIATVHPYVSYDLMGDSNWLDLVKYTTANISQGLKGSLGTLYGVEYLQTERCLAMVNSGSAGTEVVQTYILGQGNFGVSELQALEIITKPSNSGGVANPLNLYGSAGWKTGFVSKELDSNFAIRLEGATTSGSDLTAN